MEIIIKYQECLQQNINELINNPLAVKLLCPLSRELHYIMWLFCEVIIIN